MISLSNDNKKESFTIKGFMDLDVVVINLTLEVKKRTIRIAFHVAIKSVLNVIRCCNL